MTIVRKDFEIQLDEEEVEALNDARHYLNCLLINMGEELSENEKESGAYFAIKNNVQKIIIDINSFLAIPEIISK